MGAFTDNGGEAVSGKYLKTDGEKEKIDEGVAKKIKAVALTAANISKIAKLSKDIQSAMSNIDTAEVEGGDAAGAVRKIVVGLINKSKVSDALKPNLIKHFEDTVFSKWK